MGNKTFFFLIAVFDVQSFELSSGFVYTVCESGCWGFPADISLISLNLGKAIKIMFNVRNSFLVVTGGLFTLSSLIYCWK